MLSILAKFRQKLMIGQLILKLILLTSFGFFLPFQAFAGNSLEINNVEIENTRDDVTIAWRTNLNATARVDYGSILVILQLIVRITLLIFII